ncbi:MAG: asparagine synthase (glutamine-hydrolyzing) [Pseudomonadota bacterium]
MCGLAGYLGRPDRAILNAMTDAIAHRGPDADGHWIDDEAGVALGHRRLSILDLSEAGAQPMVSASGRFVTVYNGEIYNHLQVRSELEDNGSAPVWRGHSDTETLLAAIDAYGIDAAIARLHGMFAIAVWDRDTRMLTLVRDRMGEKPLYYGWQGQGPDRGFLFGSELKALGRHPAFDGQIHRQVLPEFLRHGHVGEDRTIYEGLFKVRPGEIVTMAPDGDVARHFYWKGAEVAAHQTRFTGAEDEAVADLHKLLAEVVGRQMISDVPLGAFLSGGIDSSLVVALMCDVSAGPVHTFSIGFHEARYNEAEHARAVATHLGTQHTDLYVDEATLLSVVPKLATIYDEPHADSSQIPTYLVAKLARETVTVALSGDGGDELFAGYDRYAQGARLLSGLGRLPAPIRGAAASAVQSLPKGLIDRLLDPMKPTPEGKERNGQRLHRLADYLASAGTDDLHRLLVSRWRFPETAVPGVTPEGTMLDSEPPVRGHLSDMERMMQLDMVNYLPDDILAKVDRATMAVSLESRAPLLDHRVAEFAWSLPEGLKHRDGMSKWPLRKILYDYVPRSIIDRPKMGFEVPVNQWLRGSLFEWASDLLSCDRIARDGWFDPDVIASVWDDHRSGRANRGLELWPVLVFQAWVTERSGKNGL